jgi:hypothetical protein
MVNRDDVAGAFLVEKILDACLLSLDSIKQRTCTASATGTFRSLTTGRVIRLQGAAADSSPAWIQGRHQMALIDGFDMSFERGEDGVLRPPEGLYGFMKLELKLNGDPEKPSSVGLTDFGNTDELVAVRPAEVSTATPIAGHYRSQSAEIEATIRDTDDGARLRTVGRLGSADFILECLADRVWRAKPSSPFPPSGILSFHDGGAGFDFWSMRTRAFPFRRCA